MDPNDVFIENGGAFVFSFENLAGPVTSDADAAVPETGTLALLGLGLLLLAWQRKRSR